ncbi:hypothetical protein M407DRAFT_28290 [Tulasnella calospora MUT 4182]|uniref:Uncharacterized protein n=1 Tax=Tulasnella calospora MUT 4182 TaxID=1051891 RepID=A0A0C3QAX7_9AGAM|nr:hypothetical protein M407DRAFT_28290 [Tulasnella calospora MUT 4182]
MAAESLRDTPWMVPKISDPMFSEAGGTSDMIFFIAAAIKHAEPLSPKHEDITNIIEKYQPWRIDLCQGPDRWNSAWNSIRWILSKSPAFEPEPLMKGHWRMTGMPLVRTPDQLSSRIMTEAERSAYLTWLGELAPIINEPEGPPV